MVMRNCARCGALFAYALGAPICSDCKDKDEEDFKRIKDYLYEHPGATLIELCNVLEMKMEKIRHYLKEGRLEVQGDGNMLLECESCGKSIATGRLCDGCSSNMRNGIKGANKTLADETKQRAEEEEQKKAGGLRFINKK